MFFMHCAIVVPNVNPGAFMHVLVQSNPSCHASKSDVFEELTGAIPLLALWIFHEAAQDHHLQHPQGHVSANRHLRVNEIAHALEALAPDLLFLQEVQGKNLLRSLRHEGWPILPQHHYLAGGWITRWYMA
jgi:hypothetical protein